MNLIQRVANISLNPKTEWEVIAPEASSTGSLYRDYIAPLAAIGPVSSFIGLSVVGMGIPFLGSYRMPILPGLSSMLVQYAFALIGIYLVALLIDALAPTFGAEKNKLQALKLAAYAATPAWIAGALSLLPGLALLGFLALFYSLYLLYLGLPVMMRTPKENTVGYTAVIAICTVVIAIVSGVVAGAVGGAGIAMAAAGGGATARMQDVAETMEAAARNIEATHAAAQAGDTPQAQASAAQAVADAAATVFDGQARFEVVDQARLKALLPAALPGLARSKVEAEKMKIGDFNISHASAGYSSSGDGARDIRLRITDTGGSIVFASMAAWAMVEQDKETETEYQKTGKVNGRPTHERFDKDGSDGEYSVLVGERFLVEANGRNVDMAALKNAFDAIAPAKLEAMKNEGAKR